MTTSGTMQRGLEALRGELRLVGCGGRLRLWIGPMGDYLHVSYRPSEGSAGRVDRISEDEIEDASVGEVFDAVITWCKQFRGQE